MERFLQSPQFRELKAESASVARSVRKMIAAVNAAGDTSDHLPIQVGFLLCRDCMESQDLILEMVVQEMGVIAGTDLGQSMIDALTSLNSGEDDA